MLFSNYIQNCANRKIPYFYGMKILVILLIVLSPFIINAQEIQPFGPTPTDEQQDWHALEFYLFVHFGPNTFTGLEWGKGNEKTEIFNPSQLDCRQWARIAKESGAEGIIITAKHHDGFCLWPSKYSTHTVAQSNWKNGKGDVLKDLSEACKEYGIKMGVYLSPWDRNHPDYGTEAYNEVFVNMMKEVVENYGPFFEFWWDGANGEGPNGRKQVYDWPLYIKTLREIAPNTLIFSDIGPDIRWVGNEKGLAGKTNWNLLDTAGFKRGHGSPAFDTLTSGNKFGKNWIPAECDVSIRPGWFYHAEENSKIKSAEELFQLYLKSVGRGANLLLNVPPDERGLFTSKDSASLVGFRKLFNANFFTNKNLIHSISTTGNKEKIPELLDDNEDSYTVLQLNKPIKINLNQSKPINCIVLQEPMAMGQRISKFSIKGMNGEKLVFETAGTTVGRKRIISFPQAEINTIEIKVIESKATPLLSEIAVYKIEDELVEK